ncbi:hypothetical protein GPECTOR_11g11 [Gonium pectorale]|uniref:Uncharacterized protein n=1 Tax=Gonium pectorale TaxID=33097 RepID=A0A150GP67_GONPE|nr:hypothetical protein GPECTOR_11g11 [Gonium pectorale]|eukprot:KXZ51656.1 hypothetical protein GPECTOR_11g11 [Gonium pectorale]
MPSGLGNGPGALGAAAFCPISPGQQAEAPSGGGRRALVEWLQRQRQAEAEARWGRLRGRLALWGQPREQQSEVKAGEAAFGAAATAAATAAAVLPAGALLLLVMSRLRASASVAAAAAPSRLAAYSTSAAAAAWAGQLVAGRRAIRVFWVR